MRSSKDNDKKDGKFKKKHINHDPQSESSRAVFQERGGDNA